ncbi:type III toxin-antitoxin system ToxN/AbiQ family toxin [Taylorella equigenitalis]|uniref:type III toxin-antitoxin system ToxN/AbiQ family toxin n=1 Tax=Taylorella equigenitalis TaxID=29575 RepID=UPI001E58EF90|nr:type III toxin-antitoxin system ToxN/AbiQ family toxin [Taylorella equigenitalis]WEE01166.1 type III toxin-antitoxin system ToxN/AbiQ family toxin [Taylorella equigenitalis]WEE02643.1 type III toxin-antitoxin system ToxN/AbiQ family toxin [Taylorella equigenitalis]WFD79181.1 type III toxin-antitoxin system ToxN/AbiQ family toxin [Taylorella equigenitalis]WFD80657.1 type III toxin-antitoxin system ToxN/AbiQ family toxin [Taylorella equigenitalis]WFD82135.1 type III toxin-antitoxin system Tox
MGVVFEIHIFQYFAPLSSKDFRNKKSNDTFHLISESEKGKELILVSVSLVIFKSLLTV